jgi:hybrid cluster-associated redox disulfide protein
LRKRKDIGRLISYDMHKKEWWMVMKKLLEECTVAEVLDHWPETISVFLKNKMDCVGCSMSQFETLAEAAQIYHLSLDRFLQDLRTAIQEKSGRLDESSQNIAPTLPE